MTRTIMAVTVGAAITILLIPVLQNPLVAEEMSGVQIIQKVSDQMNQETSRGVMKLTIVTTSGKERKFTYETLTAEKGQETVMKYISPVRVKGQAMLLLNNADDIWSYDPRTDRVRKLATHAKRQKMQGSDFTYEDFGGGNSFVTDFDAEREADEKIQGRDCYKIVLGKKKDSPSSYALVIMWVVKKNLVPVLIEYYDKDDPEICRKTLVQSEIRDIDGIPTALKAVMHNNLDDTDTTLEILKYEYNASIEKSRFTQRGFYK